MKAGRWATGGIRRAVVMGISTSNCEVRAPTIHSLVDWLGCWMTPASRCRHGHIVRIYGTGERRTGTTLRQQRGNGLQHAACPLLYIQLEWFIPPTHFWNHNVTVRVSPGCGDYLCIPLLCFTPNVGWCISLYILFVV